MTRSERTITAPFRLIIQGGLPHALLIEGGAGQAGRALALKLAQGLCCEKGGPCLACSGCRKVGRGIHPDVVTIESQKSVSIEEIRVLLIKTIHLRPTESEKKVYILDLSNGITTPAQNALLKSLEEPPANVHIIIICPDRSMLLETVLSRCVLAVLDGQEDFTEKVSATAHNFALALAERDELRGFSAATGLARAAKGELSEVIACLAGMFSGALSRSFSGGQDGPFASFGQKKLANCLEICDKYMRMLPQNLNPDTVAAALAVEIWEELH